MMRKYGSGPFRLALVHGGPGARGALAPVAVALASQFGVLEPIQSQYTISALIEELRGQIQSESAEPIALAGHSWGAWLATLFAAQYPEWVRRRVMSAVIRTSKGVILSERSLAVSF